jgi:ubiquinone/menaquinone biosynthesis C-methylase UbiE
VLTVDPAIVGPLGERMGLDVGCGTGRHGHGLSMTLGGYWIGLDLNEADLANARSGAKDIGLAASNAYLRGDLHHVPFSDGAFAITICSEVLEHLPQSGAALDEMIRVTAQDGLIVLSVPRRWPERICWWLSTRFQNAAYQNAPGGHVRILEPTELKLAMGARGWSQIRQHGAHALHAPYWWLRCASSVGKQGWLERQFKRLLEHQLMHHTPLIDRLDRLLSPVLGKSVVTYYRRTT